MHWRLKGAIQKVLGAVPRGDRLHHLLKQRGGGLRDFDAELTLKVEDWTLMVNHLRSVGITVPGCRFMEMGSGWYPTFPLCLYMSGAASVETLDLQRHMRADLTLKCAMGLERRVEAIAEASGGSAQDVFARHAEVVRALQRGASVQEATGGVIRYHAPADASDTHLPMASLDVVFSNSVLEHVPASVIARCFAEARRILREDGVMFHSLNCGDHYAYVDRSITQLNYLRYSAAQWEKWNNAFLYQNRLRAIDFTEMARGAGFAIEVDTSRPHARRLAELATIAVHPEFARYSKEQLAITSVDFIGRKAAVGREMAS